MQTQTFTWQTFMARLQQNGMYRQSDKLEREFSRVDEHEVEHVFCAYDDAMRVADVTLEYAKDELGVSIIRILPKEYFS